MVLLPRRRNVRRVRIGSEMQIRPASGALACEERRTGYFQTAVPARSLRINKKGTPFGMPFLV
jgi:hypothetical protein